MSWNKKTLKRTDTVSHVWVIYEVKICEKKMKNTILRKKQHVAKRERERKKGKSIKFKRGRNVSRKSDTFPFSVW